MKISEVQQQILNLIDEKMTPEEAEKIRAISTSLNDAVKDEEELAKNHEDLRVKYINLVKNGAFGESEDKQLKEEKVPSLEDIAQKVISKRRK